MLIIKRFVNRFLTNQFVINIKARVNYISSVVLLLYVNTGILEKETT